GIHFLQRLAIAFLPMSDEIAVEPAGPSHAAFQKAHLQSWKAARHPAHEHRLAHRFAGGREMTDVVVDEIGGRYAGADAARTGMKRGRDSELDAFRPHRIIIILAVESE